VARLLRDKAVAHALNHFNYDPSRRCLIGEGWVPMSKLEATRAALRRAGARAGHHAPPVAHALDASAAVVSGEKAPSFFNAGLLLGPFQAITDAYGVPRSDELNPAPFCAVTFPFLFGVMFGDVGHGLLLTAFAGSYIWREKRVKLREADMGELEQFPWHGRYVLFLMGLAATYAGLLYNDCFGCAMDLFGSAWRKEGNLGYRKDPNRTYPFGIDPVWHHATNGLSFMNSYKMKLSIVFGVAQMSLGLGCSLSNALHRKSRLDVWAEFVPQLLFLESVFGYLVYAIFLKWRTDWVAEQRPAPSLITLLIKFFMDPGRTPPDGELFEGQAGVQLALGAVAFVSVPWMLCAKPYFLRRRHLATRGFSRRDAQDLAQRRLLDDTSSQGDETPPTLSTRGDRASPQATRRGDSAPALRGVAGTVAAGGDGDAAADTSAHGGGAIRGALPPAPPPEDEFDLFEVCVHQAIHTIEFVLGAVSNTASYLRLWALSLAHNQLSVVFWTKVMVDMGLTPCADPDTPRLVCYAALILASAVWFAMTVVVLMCMESLSAFLHALRLHWVEFQNKFYKGDGRPFRPFSFEAILAEADA